MKSPVARDDAFAQAGGGAPVLGEIRNIKLGELGKRPFRDSAA